MAIACIGSRRISASISKVLFNCGFLLAASGVQIRSGGAPGADTSFEMGALAYRDLRLAHPEMPGRLADDFLQVYLPSFRFANRIADEEIYIYNKTLGVNDEAQKLASKIHPNWDRLGAYARLLMARNSHQMLGPYLNDLSDRVLCFTPDGATTTITSKTGGTGQALRLANVHGCPIDNLGNSLVMDRYQKRIREAAQKFKPWADLESLYEETCSRHAPGIGLQEGDLLNDEVLARTDVLVHGANCQHKMKSGFALQLSKKFPEALSADLATPKGAGKLGTFSQVTVNHKGRDLTIVNAYTQVSPASYKQQQEGALVVDYEAVRKVMGAVSREFNGKRVAMPKVGAGLANGCWLSIGHIIGGAFRGGAVTVYDLPSNQMSLRKHHEQYRQIGLEL